MKGIFAVFLMCVVIDCVASSLPDFPFLLSTGEARLEVQPDLVNVSLTIEDFDKEPENALSTIKTTGGELVQLITEHGVKSDDISSYQVDKRIRRSRGKSYEDLEILGYEFSQRLNFTLYGIKRYPELLEKILKIKNIDGINASFDISNREDQEAKLVSMASSNAKSNATQLSDGMGVSLGSIYALTQDSHFGSFFAQFGLKKEDFDFRGPPPQDNPGSRLGLFAPKTITLYKTIHVVYKIKP